MITLSTFLFYLSKGAKYIVKKILLIIFNIAYSNLKLFKLKASLKDGSALRNKSHKIKVVQWL